MTKKPNGYELTRNWFDFAFENHECKTQHTAIFLWIVELNNRLGWKQSFGLPTNATMEGLGIGNKRTYIDALRKINEWGFITIVSESKNQFSSTIISVCHRKSRVEIVTALDTALSHHCSSIDDGNDISTAPIDKPINNQTIKPINIESKEFDSVIQESTKKKISKKNKVDVPIKDMEKIWDDHLQNNHKVAYYANGTERGALVQIASKLIFQVNERSKRDGVINDTNDAQKIINAWQYVIGNFQKWSDFNQKLTKLSQINGQLSNIIAECKSSSVGAKANRGQNNYDAIFVEAAQKLHGDI